MTHAIRIHEHGGPDVLRWEEVEVGVPGPGEVRLHQTAAGLNFLDVYQRNGAYKLPELPTALGMEAAGVVEEVGEGVKHLSVGDRIGYADMPAGAYSEARVMPAKIAVKTQTVAIKTILNGPLASRTSKPQIGKLPQ